MPNWFTEKGRIKMKTAKPIEPLTPPPIKPENIGFSGAKSPATTDQSSKLFQWDQVTAGNCTLSLATLELRPDGWAWFGGNLSSSGSSDSWGILRFNLRQANGLPVSTPGPFWSPTISDVGPWTFLFQYPENLFGIIASVDFDSHC
jgi:hypothetical protein